jgi:hypothetical protein
MTAPTRLLSVAVLALAVLSSASCNLPAQASPAPTVCDGVTSDAGGCTTERHEFSGTTCDDLAREWGSFVDKLAVAVIAGPDDIRGEAKSVRLKTAVLIASLDMNERMRDLSLRSECDVDGVLRVAEPLFSEALRSGVGGTMYDGDPMVGYDDWIVDVRRSLQVIDDED